LGCFEIIILIAFLAVFLYLSDVLTLLIGRQEGHPACKTQKFCFGDPANVDQLLKKKPEVYLYVPSSVIIMAVTAVYLSPIAQF